MMQGTFLAAIVPALLECKGWEGPHLLFRQGVVIFRGPLHWRQKAQTKCYVYLYLVVYPKPNRVVG